MALKKAVKSQSKLRFALLGPSGSGKTCTALRIARGIGGRVALLCSEHGSAAKYAPAPNAEPTGLEFDFDMEAPSNFDVEVFIRFLQEAVDGGYDVAIIDGLSAAWNGRGGLLEQVDRDAKASRSGSSFDAWRNATPKQNKLIDAILACPIHVIVTMRVKMEYVLEENERGKKVPRKVGLAPIQRDGMEYEFDIVGELTREHELAITKSRYAPFADQFFETPGEELGARLRDWLAQGAPAAAAPNGPRTIEQVSQIQRLVDELTRLRPGEPHFYVPGFVGHKNKLSYAEAERTLQHLKALVTSLQLKQTVEQGKARGLTGIEAVKQARAGGEDPPVDAPKSEPAGASGGTGTASPQASTTKAQEETSDQVTTMPAAPGPRAATRPRSTKTARGAAEPTTPIGVKKAIDAALDILCEGKSAEHRKSMLREYVPEGSVSFASLKEALAALRMRITTLGLADVDAAGQEAPPPNQPVGRNQNDDDLDTQVPLRA